MIHEHRDNTSLFQRLTATNQPEIITLLTNVDLPLDYLTRMEAENALSGLRASVSISGTREIEKIKTIERLLSDACLIQLIDEGKISFVFIKPDSFNGRNLPASDELAAQTLLSEFDKLRVIFKFNYFFDHDDANEFYGALRENLGKIIQNGKPVWDALTQYMTNGPITFALLFKPDGDAVNETRKKMGATKASKADPDTIRGTHAIEENLPNNLIHGSDSVEAAKKEVNFLRTRLKKIIAENETIMSKFPSENTLLDLGVLKNNDHLVNITIISSESNDQGCTSEYLVRFTNAEGTINSGFLSKAYDSSRDRISWKFKLLTPHLSFFE